MNPQFPSYCRCRRKNFKNNILEIQLLHDLTRECIEIRQFNQQIAQLCLVEVRGLIDTIDKDFEAGETPNQVCVDLKDCAASQTCIVLPLPTRSN
uniref:Saposin B-type domain-containing protein n=1 Tax=Strongyloides venezuelensis TaxID=75913 RepID=A0A0K0FVU6_STRVS